MKTFNELGIQIPEILLPSNNNIEKWAVVACDQYTQDKEYWKNVEEITKDNPSSLNIIFPEVYLNEENKQERIAKIKATMKDYLNSSVFAQEKKQFIYLERTTAYNRTRKGLMVAIDLETYEWKPFSKALIRATEATIIDRIPPRMEIRRGANLEMPHIMLLINDKDNDLIEKVGNLVKTKTPVYDGKLMLNSGSITGWGVCEDTEINTALEAINKIAENNIQSDGSTFLFAVGDGNHSLATAKAIWDELKEANGGIKASDGTISIPKELENHNARFALVEIVNIYDTGLTFEPIHRVLFNVKPQDLLTTLAEKLNGTVTDFDTAETLENNVKNSVANFGFTYTEDGIQKYKCLSTNITELAVSKLQPVLDEFIKNAPNQHICDENGCRLARPEIDYIHGSSEVFRLGKQENAISILLPPVEKDSFFQTISKTGPLPRKSFSMGEADEKRFYLECRKLFAN